MSLRYGNNNHIISYRYEYIRRYTAISGIVDIVYYVDDRVAFDVATFDNKIIAIAITQRAYRYNNQLTRRLLHYADAK